MNAETFFALMNGMVSSDPLEFMESKGVEAAKDNLLRNRELEAQAKIGVSVQRAIEQAQKQHSTKEGRRTCQALLTAAAFGDDEESAPKMSAKRKAATIGVREHTFNFAVDRVKRSRADLHPSEAIKRGVYWFWPRAKKNDAANDNW